VFEYGLRTFVSKKRRRKAFLFVLSLVFQEGKFLSASPYANVLEKVCRGRFFFTSPSPFFCVFIFSLSIYILCGFCAPWVRLAIISPHSLYFSTRSFDSRFRCTEGPEVSYLIRWLSFLQHPASTAFSNPQKNLKKKSPAKKKNALLTGHRSEVTCCPVNRVRI
jgi:hypothetical protein